MVSMEKEMITLVFIDNDIKIKREFNIDKKTGNIFIRDIDTVSNEIVNQIYDSIMNLDTVSNIFKYI